MIPFKLMQEKRNKMAVHQNVIITRKPPGAGLGRGSHSSRGLKRVERKGSSSSIQTQCCQHSQSPAGSHNYLVFGWPSPLILAAIYLAPNWAWIHRSKWAGSIWKTDCTAANPQFSCLVSCTYLCWMYVDPPNEDSHVCSMWMKYTTVYLIVALWSIHGLDVISAWPSWLNCTKKFIHFKIIWGSKITNWGLNLDLAPGENHNTTAYSINLSTHIIKSAAI